MQKEYKSAYKLLNNNVLHSLDLPEDKNFMSQLRNFQSEVKLLESKLELDTKLAKNIYFIVSELVQAVMHNGVFIKEIFVNNVKVAFADNIIFLLSQNVVATENIPRIQLKFDEVNSAFDAEDTHAELQLRYDHKLKTKPRTRQMVSVGVLDLARRSFNKILYDFEIIDDSYAIFSIICSVNVE